MTANPSPRLATLVGLLIVTLALPTTSAVGPGAQLYVNVLEDNGGDVWVRVSPTGDAPEGNVTILARLIAEPYNGTGPQTLLEQVATILIPAPSPERRFNTTNIHFELPPLVGVYRLRASIYGNPEGAGAAWDEYSRLIPFGTPPPNLAHGWGRIQATGVSSLDLTGSGSPNLQIRDDAGAPSVWNVSVEAIPWESKTGRGWSFTLRAWNPQDENASAHFILNASTVRTILQASPDQELRTQQGEEGTIHVGPDEIRVDFEPKPFPPGTWWTRSVFASVSTVFPQPVTDITTRGWYNGYQTRVNLTTWDLDADGTTDILFWQNTATTDTDARAQTEAIRRSTPAKLAVHAIVNETLTGRLVDFEVFRTDGSHAGAWMEIRSPEAAIRQALASPYMDPNARLQYELSLPPPEGFVEERDNVTWAWFGHFSTQRLRILAPFDTGRLPWADSDGDGVANADDTCNGNHDGVPGCEERAPTTSSRLPGSRETGGEAPSVPGISPPAILIVGVLAALGGWMIERRRRP